MTPADRIAQLERERDDLKRAFLNASEVIADQDHRLETLVAERDAAIKRAEEADNDYAILSIANTALEHDYNSALALNAKLVEALRKVRKLIGKGGGTTYTAADEEMYNITADALDAAGKGVGK